MPTAHVGDNDVKQIVYRPLLKTALVTAALVGTVLTSINQGNVLASGRFPTIL